MKFTPEKASAFLHVLSETCNVGKACAAVEISRRTAYNWRNDDPAFADAWAEAMAVGVTALEDEAHRRGFEGTLEPVFHQGVECGAVRKYSDTLAIFLLKAHAPEKYRENSKIEMSGHLAINSMSEEDMRAELAALAAEGILPVAQDDGRDLV